MVMILLSLLLQDANMKAANLATEAQSMRTELDTVIREKVCFFRARFISVAYWCVQKYSH